jgi:sec-independent protein translocase protein TatB
MFDISSMKLLIVGLVLLIVVGPKDLPALLRTIGKYVGVIRRQAAEFRAQFDEAMRESELQTLRDELDAMKRDVKATVDSAGRTLESEVASAHRDLDAKIKAPSSAAVLPSQIEPTIHSTALPRADDAHIVGGTTPIAASGAAANDHLTKVAS